jgi:hypothetical protein
MVVVEWAEAMVAVETAVEVAAVAMAGVRAAS